MVECVESLVITILDNGLLDSTFLFQGYRIQLWQLSLRVSPFGKTAHSQDSSHLNRSWGGYCCDRVEWIWLDNISPFLNSSRLPFNVLWIPLFKDWMWCERYLATKPLWWGFFAKTADYTCSLSFRGPSWRASWIKTKRQHEKWKCITYLNMHPFNNLWWHLSFEMDKKSTYKVSYQEFWK
jgi:hypothetical protein